MKSFSTVSEKEGTRCSPPGMAGINQGEVKWNPEQHQIGSDRIEEKLALFAAFSHRLPLVI